eukprot:6004544-Amphidinium_carterae.1
MSYHYCYGFLYSRAIQCSLAVSSRGFPECCYDANPNRQAFNEPEVLRDSNLDVRVAIRMPADEDKLYLIHHEGMSTLNYSTGTITEMESDVWSWAGILTAAYNPGDPSNAYVFHKTGLYKVNLFEATYERVGELKWTVAAAAVYSRRLEAILLFFGRGYTAGCCVVNLDGTVSKTYTKFKHLDQAVAAVETRNPDQVFVIYRCGSWKQRLNSHGQVIFGKSLSDSTALFTRLLVLLCITV